MAWSVEHEHHGARFGWNSLAPAAPHIFLAVSGREEALQFAKNIIGAGGVVWCIKDDAGGVMMDREQVQKAVSTRAEGA